MFSSKVHCIALLNLLFPLEQLPGFYSIYSTHILPNSFLINKHEVFVENVFNSKMVYSWLHLWFWLTDEVDQRKHASSVCRPLPLSLAVCIDTEGLASICSDETVNQSIQALSAAWLSKASLQIPEIAFVFTFTNTDA